MPSCWVEVNLDALRHNVRAIRGLVGEDTTIMAVVKANAYGHGAVEVSRALVDEGASYLAVTRLDEALPLRQAGLQTPILLLTPALPDEVESVVEHDLTACLSSLPDAERLSTAAARQGKPARAHLKVNTGMGRLGVEPEDALDVVQQAVRFPHLQLEAIFTHFAFATERDHAPTHRQYNLFQPLIHQFARAAGTSPKGCHCANSAALLRFPAMRLSCVRPGTILYGQYPSSIAAEAAQSQNLELREGFEVKACVVAVKTLSAGQTVGYGGEWRAARPSQIATIAVGYADGLTQQPQARSTPARAGIGQGLRQAGKQIAQGIGLKDADPARSVLLRGQSIPIIGRIAMQQCSIDITGIEGVQVGDEVSVSMRRTSAGAHLPRLYVNNS